MAENKRHYSFSNPERSKPSIRGVLWPVVYPPDISRYLSILHYFERSERYPAEKIQRSQFKQLQLLLKHAARTVPYYKQLFKTNNIRPENIHDIESWQTIPLLKRQVLQNQYDQLISRRIPSAHGKTYETITSGSTGTPVRVLKTRLMQFFWDAVKLRDHYWHQRETDNKKHAAIRYVEDTTKANPPDGLNYNTWSYPLNWLSSPGSSSLLSMRSTISEQLAWLSKQDPDYLLTNPSILYALAQAYAESDKKLSKLEQLLTIGECLDPEVREYCEQAFNVPLKDVYSSQEVGYIALQCPENNHYHVQSETVLVEILDDNDNLCNPGETGRVVVTVLHNFAMPLIRYEIGDYAEVGEVCPCGRGLSVLKNIKGRVRNMLTLPSGDKVWPQMRTLHYAEITKADIKQAQLIQHSLEEIEVRLVVAKILNKKQQKKLTVLIQEALGHKFNIRYSFTQEIPRGKGGKFEEFVSKLEAGS